MTLEKHSFTFDVCCDFCPYHEQVDEENFNEAVAKIKEAGWRIRKDGAEWTHKCPGCVEADSASGFEDVS